MFRKSERHHRQHTKPDHRPMLPEWHAPEDPLDLSIREARRRYEEANSNRNQKWR
jgi:hypothetical protein